MRGDPRLNARGGLYAVDFGDRVKIGATSNLRSRLQDHTRTGGLQFRAYPISLQAGRGQWWRWGTEALIAAETAALTQAAQRGRQIGKSEHFTDLTLDEAAECVRDSFTAHIGGPVHEMRPIVVDIYGPLDQLGGLSEVLRTRITERALAAVARYAA